MEGRIKLKYLNKVLAKISEFTVVFVKAYILGRIILYGFCVKLENRLIG